MPDLSGKVAIVTGGSQGTGRGIVHCFAQAGADVVVAARTQGPIDQVVDEVRAMGRRAIGVSTDVTSAADAQNLVDRTVAEFGRVDVLVNCAGGNFGRDFRRAPLLELTSDEFDACIGLNLKSVFLVGQASAKVMMAQGQGVIINIGSGAPWNNEPTRTGFAFYATAKAGIPKLTVSMASEWSPTIRVNCVLPGFIDNPKVTPGRTPELIAMRVQGIAAGRIGQPDDVGNMCVFLASDDASFVDGATIEVTGGKRNHDPNVMMNATDPTAAKAAATAG